MARETVEQKARGERKQITAVFIDVVGFSNIASTADAEDLQQWLEAFYAQAGQIVSQQGGEVTEYLGDGVVALFGLARADELSATRAVNAALLALQHIDASPGPGMRMQLRVGVATGEAAVRGEDAPGNLPRATGMVTTLARRVQEAAQPGEVLIAAETHALLRGSISAEPVPDQILKGFETPQTLYRPRQGVGSPSDPTAVVFVAREAERARIAQSSEPCLIVGQAGIGKSALLRRVVADAQAATIIGAEGLNTQASYQPFQQWISAVCGTSNLDMAALSSRFGGLTEDAQLALALVMGLPDGQRLLTEKSNLALKGLIEESLWSALQSIQPAGVIAFEDLHWFDAASFGVLVQILSSGTASAYQIVLTSREDTKIGRYLGRLPLTTIPLDPLGDEDARTMLAALQEQGAQIGDTGALLAQAGGVPLFLEQLFKRATSGSAASTDVPGSLMDLLSSQIEAAGEAKPVLQYAAIIGAEFDADTLGALVQETGELQGNLQSAVAQGVLVAMGGQRYRFAHALMQRAAYQGMLRATRVSYHGQFAAYLAEEQAATVQRNPALLADHLRLAQQYIPAIQTYLAASQAAMFQGAFEDAEAHVQTAITLCGEAPAENDVTALEIACHSALGSIRMQTLGFTAQPVRDAFETVAALAARQNAYSVANGPAFYGSFTHGIVSGDRVAADRFSLLLRTAAQAIPGDQNGFELQVASYNVDAALHFYTGNFARQFEAFTALRPIYDVMTHGAMIATYGADTFAAAQMFEVAGRAIVGDTHLIEALLAETDAHQQLLNIPVMAPWAQIWGAVPLFYAGKVDEAVSRVMAGLETATKQGAVFWQVTGGAWLHVMDPSQSETSEGLAAFKQVIGTHEAIGANVGLPYFRAHYAQALARHGEMAAAYQASLQAVRENADNGLQCWYPEVLRLHAAICEQTDRAEQAMQHLEEAAAVAEAQGAKLWQLRTGIAQARSGFISPTSLLNVVDRLDPRAEMPEVAVARTLIAA